MIDQCNARVPDHTDFWPCGKPAVRLNLCADHLKAEVAFLQERVQESEAKIRQDKARSVALLGGPEAVREGEAERAWAT